MTTLTQYANASVIAKDDLGKDPSSDWSLQTNDNMTVTGPSQLSMHNKVMDCLRFFYKKNKVMSCDAEYRNSTKASSVKTVLTMSLQIKKFYIIDRRDILLVCII